MFDKKIFNKWKRASNKLLKERLSIAVNNEKIYHPIDFYLGVLFELFFIIKKI